MAYIGVYQRGKLLARRELAGPTVVGRARGCDLWIADFRVSRQHCRIEPEGSDLWAVVDLDSRNGTQLSNGKSEQPVRRHVLAEGDEVLIGDTVLRFYGGKLPPQRPADPEAALEAARGSGEPGREERIPESWKGPLPKPEPSPAYPGQTPTGEEDVPSGSTVLGYGREGKRGWASSPEAASKLGPPPELPDAARNSSHR